MEFEMRAQLAYDSADDSGFGIPSNLIIANLLSAGFNVSNRVNATNFACPDREAVYQ